MLRLFTAHGAYQYDPQRADVRDPKGRPVAVTPWLPETLDTYLDMIGCRNPAHKSPYPNLVYLVLGHGCNHSCEYCMQKDFARKEMPHDAGAFLAKVRRNKSLFSEVGHFLFWGGEPLLYFEQLREIVLCLRREALVPPWCKFVLNSNGTLLTPQMAAFFHEQDIRLIISHDGPGQALRCRDPLDETNPVSRKLMLAMAARRDTNFLLTSTIHTANPSRRELLRTFGATFGQDFDFPLYAFSLFFVNNASLGVNPYLSNPLESFSREITEYAEGVAERFFDFHLLASKYLYRLAYQHHNMLETYESNYDVSNLKRLRMNMDGELTAFHIGDFSPAYLMGTIDSILDLTLPQGRFMGGCEAVRARCANCPVLPLCAGGECYIAPHLEEQDCLSKFLHYLPMWLYMTAVYVLKTPITDVRIEGDFRHAGLLAACLASDTYQMLARQPGGNRC